MKRRRVGDFGGDDDIVGDGVDGDVRVRSAEGEVAKAEALSRYYRFTWSRSQLTLDHTFS